MKELLVSGDDPDKEGKVSATPVERLIFLEEREERTDTEMFRQGMNGQEMGVVIDSLQRDRSEIEQLKTDLGLKS